MLELPRTQIQATAAEIPSIRPRSILRAGVFVPILFLLFGAWGAMMSIPSFRAIAAGISLSDQILVMDHGKRVLEPVWQAALPGLMLGIAGLLGAIWAYMQYRLPEPRLPQNP
jgi:hypothetical protein